MESAWRFLKKEGHQEGQMIRCIALGTAFGIWCWRRRQIGIGGDGRSDAPAMIFFHPSCFARDEAPRAFHKTLSLPFPAPRTTFGGPVVRTPFSPAAVQIYFSLSPLSPSPPPSDLFDPSFYPTSLFQAERVVVSDVQHHGRNGPRPQV